MARVLRATYFSQRFIRMIVSAVRRGKYIFRLRERTKFKSFIWKLSSFPAKREVIPSIFRKGNGILVVRLFRTNSNEPFAPFFVGTKVLGKFHACRHRVSILNVNFKHNLNSQMLLSRLSRTSFLQRGRSFFNSRKPSFGSTINICLGINNYARIKLSFIRSFLFQRDERNGWTR